MVASTSPLGRYGYTEPVVHSCHSSMVRSQLVDDSGVHLGTSSRVGTVHRRVVLWLGKGGRETRRLPLCIWHVGRRSIQMKRQQIRTQGSSTVPQRVQPAPPRKIGLYFHRQHNCGILCERNGEWVETCQSGWRGSSLVPGSEHHPVSSSHHWQPSPGDLRLSSPGHSGLSS